MDGSSNLRTEVARLITDKIDSVPHLEALLLLWNTRPKRWKNQEVAKRLYVKTEVAHRILQDLLRHGLISAVLGATEEYSCEMASDERGQLLDALDETYKHELIRISTMIHSKASSAVREFARAFRFTKERD